MIELIIGVLVFLIVWTLSSITWAVMALGRKNEPSKWYDYVLSPPALCLAYLVGSVGSIANR